MFATLFLTLLGLSQAASLQAGDKNPVVVMETSLGTMTIELYPKKARDSVKQFLQFIAVKYYDGTIVHSADKTMIQGGGYMPKLVQKPSPPPMPCDTFNGLKNEKGTVAFLQYKGFDDSPAVLPHILINVVHNKELDKNDNKIGSEVFGKVIDGVDVLDKIAKVRTASKGKFKNVPVDDVLIKSIRVKEGGKDAKQSSQWSRPPYEIARVIFDSCRLWTRDR